MIYEGCRTDRPWVESFLRTGQSDERGQTTATYSAAAAAARLYSADLENPESLVREILAAVDSVLKQAVRGDSSVGRIMNATKGRADSHSAGGHLGLEG